MVWANPAFGLLAAGGLTVGFVYVMAPLADRLGLVDHPNYRKPHGGRMPLVGGLAMYLAFLLAASVLLPKAPVVRALVMGAGLLVFIGTVDDWRPLSHYVRFGAQIVAALVLYRVGGVVLHDLGRIGPSGELLSLGSWAIPITVFATVGVINAINMSDGMDGLAGSLLMVALGAIAVVAATADHTMELGLALLLMAVLAGFLYFNLRLPWRSRALVFMGDAGSMFLGLSVACLVILLSQGDDRAMTPATGLWILALPLIDAVSMMLRRLVTRRSPFAADREHYHHVLVQAGFSVPQALMVIVMVSALFGAVGLAGLYVEVPETVMFYGFVAVFALHFILLMRTWSKRRFLNRELERRGGLNRRVAGDRRARPGAWWRGADRRERRERRMRPERRDTGIQQARSYAASATTRRPGTRREEWILTPPSSANWRSELCGEAQRMNRIEREDDRRTDGSGPGP